LPSLLLTLQTHTGKLKLIPLKQKLKHLVIQQQSMPMATIQQSKLNSSTQQSVLAQKPSFLTLPVQMNQSEQFKKQQMQVSQYF